jgi:uncharacterized membrane protein
MIEASFAERMRFRLLSWIAFGGVVLVGAQIGVLLTRGEALCFSDGCRVVESLTRIPPLFFNLIGFGWFAATAAVLRRAVRRPWYDVDWPRVLLLGGLAVEGVLFGYQLFVARAFCAYCLTIFAVVVALNLLAGRDQVLRAGAVFGSMLLMFSLLRFGVSRPEAAAGTRALDAGTYAVRRCSDPAKQLYLIFSSKCPHCQDVIRTLENCNSCNFHFNPIDRLGSFELAGIELSASYQPEVNQNLLSLLGIEEVPVLLAVGPEGISVIKGQQAITGFIKEECFRTAPVLYLDPSRPLESDSLRLIRQGDDGCNATVECEDQKQKP